MRGYMRSIDRLVASLLQWEPATCPKGPELDWLPPVLGPADWSSGELASMADRSAAWYFDRAAGEG